MSKGPRPVAANIRFDAKWRLDSETGCHEWTATKVSSGYGCIYVNGVRRQILAHRFAYERANGPIPKGLHIDHLCRNKSCVNAAHLEAVTRQENHRRVGWKAKTHCPRGHAMTTENVYVRPNGGRRCRTCERAAAKAGAKDRYVPRQSPTYEAGLLALAFC